MGNSILEAVCGIAMIACLFLAVIGHFMAMANRKPGISRWRAYNWFGEIAFRRNVYLEDLFSDTGKWWGKATLLAIPGIILSAGLAGAISAMARSMRG